jgi:hypothetical protein
MILVAKLSAVHAGGEFGCEIRSLGTVISMGDKSPKAKDKSKKQHTADKNQKHAAAVEKAKPASSGAAKKGH